MKQTYILILGLINYLLISLDTPSTEINLIQTNLLTTIIINLTIKLQENPKTTKNLTTLTEKFSQDESLETKQATMSEYFSTIKSDPEFDLEAQFKSVASETLTEFVQKGSPKSTELLQTITETLS